MKTHEQTGTTHDHKWTNETNRNNKNTFEKTNETNETHETTQSQMNTHEGLNMMM